MDISSQELSHRAGGDSGEGEAAASKEMVPSEEHNYVQDMVQQNRVVVFSKTHCPHCTDSKTLLSGMGVDYKTVELDQINNGNLVQNVLGSITDARTVSHLQLSLFILKLM